MRPPSLGEEEVLKQTKDNKRRRASPPDTPKPKKSRARKSKTDLAILPADVVQTLRDEDKEGEDVDCLLVARKREGIEISRTIEPMTVEEVQTQTEVISKEGPGKVPESSGVEDASCRDEQPATTLHRESSSKYRAELARCEADIKKLMEERDALKLLYVQKEEEIMSIRAELTRAHQDQTELIEQVQQKAELVEQLREEAKMKEAETLGWKQNVDRLASEKDEGHIRGRVEAANTRAKEISDAAEVRLSRVAEHARRQSRRETLEEVHARGFDLTVDIESAKVLEDEAEALLSDDEDSVSGSENGGDEDEAPEDAAPEAD
ncbi:vicilin-like seed storage protein At2g18540 [Nicotiana tomentosiformis]|uniref:vicilin-like seed storage protein At2g18540 n=1 Tax=Nicotiana tomentosiformis TaxID=4098 RepID=UPI00388CE735